jgi:hypothetical protein
MDLKQKVEQAFNLLQRMEIVAAQKNVNALSYTLGVLQEVYIRLDNEAAEHATEAAEQGAEAQKEGEANGAD